MRPTDFKETGATGPTLNRSAGWAVSLALGLCVLLPSNAGCAAPPAYAGATNWLIHVQDQFHAALDVYSDKDAAGNHFVARGKLTSGGGETAVPSMDEGCTNAPHSGVTSIEATFLARTNNWGGWYFMNGILRTNDVNPTADFGNAPNAGVNLTGATRLTFWIRGKTGGEQVECFAFGVGWGPAAAHPDSSSKLSTGYLTLTTNWTRYALDVSGTNLTYVLGGFGWVTAADQNGNRDVTFYLDDIQYDKPRLAEPRFLLSYTTLRSTNAFDMVMRNVAFTYDNAVALLAFLSAGETNRARLIADALVYAQAHDRFYADGRLRNGYQAGDLVLAPGWTPNDKTNTVRMPGWFDAGTGTWFEDRGHVGTSAGNLAWAMVALLAWHEAGGGASTSYLAAAAQMGDWVEANCRDSRGAGGYTAGVEGWEPTPSNLTYKATEHNIDLVAAFGRLGAITGDAKWTNRANHAKTFVASMYNSAGTNFWTGTDADGVTINQTTIPLDIQVWAILALRDDGAAYTGAMAYADSHLKVENGYDFNTDRDGVWYEGTAQMAVGWQYAGHVARGWALVDYLVSAQAATGGLYAADRDGLTTGFSLPDGMPWLYYHRLHVAATAWLVLAEQGYNPFWGRTWHRPPTRSPIWLGATSMADEWWWFTWFGYFCQSGDGWIYHAEHGWMFCVGDSTASIWFWTPRLGWMWSSAGVYPFLWRPQGSTWMWYYRGTGHGSGGWFYNYATGQVTWL